MIIPVLHLEKEVQLKDLTRITADKSILVKGSVDHINAVKIKPGADSAEVNVFGSGSPEVWFLDYYFTAYKFDVDSSNNSISFQHNLTDYNVNAADGTYTLAALLTEIKTKIEAAAAVTVTLNLDDRNTITILASDSSFKIKFKKSSELLKHLGFSKDDQTKGFPVEYGIRKVTLTVESISESAVLDEYVKVYTKEGDALFSEDADLLSYESEIMKWLPRGRGSYLDLHRKAQKLIIDWIDRQGYRDDQNEKINKFAFVDNSDVRLWSVYTCLNLFFMGNQNASDDVFKEKAKHYHKLEIEARDRAVLNLDLDNDGVEDVISGPDIRSGRLYFR